MKLTTCLKCLAAGVMILGLAALLTSAAAASGPIRLGAGVYGVYGIPVAQDNVAAGALYGAKVRADLAGPFGAEVSYTSYPAGDITFATQLGDQTTKGWSQSVMAADLILQTSGPSGFGIYFLGGIGQYTLKKDLYSDISRIGYNGGLGMEFRSVAGFSVDICGRVHAMPYENGGTHKFAALQAGVNFYFLR
jgi:hypothetical protein